jgi:hypothetical protein
MEDESKKTKRPDATQRARGTSSSRGNGRQKRPAAPAELSRATRAALKTLTPDRLRTLWGLHHPDRPEVRSSLERLYRLPY